MVSFVMSSYNSVTDTSQEEQLQQEPQFSGSALRSAGVVFAMVAVLVAILLGASANAAASDDVAAVQAVGNLSDVEVAEPVSQQSDVASDASEIPEDGGEVDERDEQIETLSDQVVLLQQALIGFGSQIEDTPEAVEAPEALDRRSAEFQAQSRAQWRMGYTIGGGENFEAFENTILPCESGTQPDPDLAVGRTDDWGRAQINRPVWKARFESLTGATFEDNITNPVLNGFMAAHVEQEQGLTAWTCWRLR